MCGLAASSSWYTLKRRMVQKNLSETWCLLSSNAVCAEDRRPTSYKFVCTNEPPPLVVNKFNISMKYLMPSISTYIPLWMNCLDNSMSSWFNKDCPGFIFLPQKPHPRGNEYHSVADGTQGKSIM